jgi:hypothetical protein
MYVPKGKPLHANLSTSYVDVGALLADLQVNGFTGYVQVELRGYDSYVFLDQGALIGALEQTDTASRTGSDAVNGMLVRSQQRDGTVSIYEHPQQIIQALAGVLDGEVVYQGLTSEFTDLQKLIRKLEREKELTWFVEVNVPENGGLGVLFVQNGECEGVYSQPDSPTLLGEAAITAMLEVAELTVAIINVYSAQPELQVTPVAEPGDAPPKRLQLVEREASPDTHELGTLEAIDEEDPLIRLLADVVHTIEDVVTARDGAGSFAVDLRAGQLDVADRYPFLDPFRAEFEYHAGEIVFVGETAPERFAEGLGEALHVTVAALSRRDGVEGERLRQRICEALAALYASRKSEFDSFGLGGLITYVSEAGVPGETTPAEVG